jgi:hypothetical protein
MIASAWADPEDDASALAVAARRSHWAQQEPSQELCGPADIRRLSI